MFANYIILLLIDALFLGACALLLWPVSRARRPMAAVLKRNFVGYFSNPTGYVFLCLFVLLSSIAAFFPHEFFAQNLATLHQLSQWFPYIMLGFIPAITMSIWAEERRQGTDELLLTIPASDWDIVAGKYLAAAAVFTVSLLFSQISNFVVLNFLSKGGLDVGLFATTYFGYWLMGLAMLAVGMVASFLTNNLTVGFILGAVFNMPLVFLGMADAIISSRDWAYNVSRWSLSSQFEGYGRGVVSMAATTFFAMVIALGLYLSAILIGRRHWLGGKDGPSMVWHYLARAVALVATVVGANLFFSRNDTRIDATSQQVSSLSADSLKLIDNLDTKDRPVVIEAFLSRSVPKQYVQTRVDLISMLNEFKNKKNIQVQIYDDLEPFSEGSARAEEQYGIKPQTLVTEDRGTYKQEEIFLGAAFTCGLEKVVVPFFDYGVPVEYELIRSVRTVAKQQRKRLGVVKTDVELFGGFDMSRFTSIPKMLIIDELEKQYEVVQVDASSAIDTKLDALLVVQPSSLPQPQLDNVINALKAGVPAAIFEDPHPTMPDTGSAPGTGEPRRPKGGGMGMMGGMGSQPPEPKGDVRQLWSILGVEMRGQDGFSGFTPDVIWQDWNPYAKISGMPQVSPEWVFASPESPNGEEAMNPEDPVSQDMQELLFLFPGSVREHEAKGLTFTPLVQTGDRTGTISPEVLKSRDDPEAINYQRRESNKRFILAARIRGPIRSESTTSTGANSSSSSPGEQDGDGKSGDPKDGDPKDQEKPDSPAADEGKGKADAGGDKKQDDAPANKELHTVFVADIDCLASDFLRVRMRPDQEYNWKFENVTFVLNVIDSLTGDEDFINVRKRRTRHSTLSLVDDYTDESRREAQKSIAQFDEDFRKARTEAEASIKKAANDAQAEVEKLRKKAEDERMYRTEELERAVLDAAIKQKTAEQKFNREQQKLTRDRDRQLQEIRRDLDGEVSKVQNLFKMEAALLPVLPPLLVGLLVFLRRHAMEKEGVSRERLR